MTESNDMRTENTPSNNAFCSSMPSNSMPSTSMIPTP